MQKKTCEHIFFDRLSNAELIERRDEAIRQKQIAESDIRMWDGALQQRYAQDFNQRSGEFQEKEESKNQYWIERNIREAKK